MDPCNDLSRTFDTSLKPLAVGRITDGDGLTCPSIRLRPALHLDVGIAAGDLDAHRCSPRDFVRRGQLVG